MARRSSYRARRRARVRVKKWTISGATVAVVVAGGYFAFNHFGGSSAQAGAKHTTSTKSVASQTPALSSLVHDPSVLSSRSMAMQATQKDSNALSSANLPTYPAETLPPNTPVGPGFNWSAPSGGPYPDLKKYNDVWIDVSLTKQRIYIKSSNQTIYTMITSSGVNEPDTYTPTGTYYVQPERGTWFYDPSIQEGAEYWVSWKGHGEYLFHTVPMNSQRQILPVDAQNLGVRDSHGCFHLTISDAKWIYDNIPTGTKVVIHN